MARGGTRGLTPALPARIVLPLARTPSEVSTVAKKTTRTPARRRTGDDAAPQGSVFDVRLLRQLTSLMVANDLQELDLREGDRQILLRRGCASTIAPPPAHPAPPQAPAHPAPAPAHPAPAPPTPAPPAPAEAPAPAEPAAAEEAGLIAIKSPMVGTFYASPDPNSPPYVSVGDHVNPDTVVCIIEAMKVFNEIQAEVAGTIVKVLVNNEQPVEYGQPLFLVRPD